MNSSAIRSSDSESPPEFDDDIDIVRLEPGQVEALELRRLAAKELPCRGTRIRDRAVFVHDEDRVRRMLYERETVPL
jgi:hypothetical protein